MGFLADLGRSEQNSVSIGSSLKALADKQRAIRAGKAQGLQDIDKRNREVTRENLENIKTGQEIQKNKNDLEATEIRKKQLESTQNIDELVERIWTNPVIREQRKAELRSHAGDPNAQVVTGYQIESSPRLKGLLTTEGKRVETLEKQAAWAKTARDVTSVGKKLRAGIVPKEGEGLEEYNNIKMMYGIKKAEDADAVLQQSRQALTSLGVPAGKITKGTAYNDKEGVRRVPFYQDGKKVSEEILDGSMGPTGDNENFSPQDIANLQNLSPSELYTTHGYRVNDDGTLYLNPTSKQPVVLPRADKVLGKRGNMKAIMTLGEAWDDAKELTTLLAIPEVKADLQSAKKAGLWDRVKGSFSNKIQLWMQENGIAPDSKTAETIARVQYMASEKRKAYLGTAITEIEMKSATAWMPQAGDSFETMMTKTNLMSHEAEETFTRWLDTFKNVAQMGPYYDAFGIDRFGAKPTKDDWNVTVDADGNFKVGTGQGG